MGKLIPMTRRRTYKNQAPEPGYPEPSQQPGPVGDPGYPAPAPGPARSTWLRTALTIAGSAIVGAVAIDLYRKYTRGGSIDEEVTANPAQTGLMGAALPGAPQVMPMPMPIPMPMPMPMPNFGMPAPNYGAPPAPLSDSARIEIARLEAEKARAEADTAHLRAWEDGDID